MKTGDAPAPIADIQAVTPGYFEAMAIPVSEGRRFDQRVGSTTRRSRL